MTHKKKATQKETKPFIEYQYSLCIEDEQYTNISEKIEHLLKEDIYAIRYGNEELEDEDEDEYDEIEYKVDKLIFKKSDYKLERLRNEFRHFIYKNLVILINNTVESTKEWVSKRVINSDTKEGEHIISNGELELKISDYESKGCEQLEIRNIANIEHNCYRELCEELTNTLNENSKYLFKYN
jgi:hypothetical protein